MSLRLMRAFYLSVFPTFVDVGVKIQAVVQEGKGF